jgi:hypothetical protein
MSHHAGTKRHPKREENVAQDCGGTGFPLASETELGDIVQVAYLSKMPLVIHPWHHAASAGLFVMECSSLRGDGLCSEYAPTMLLGTVVMLRTSVVYFYHMLCHRPQVIEPAMVRKRGRGGLHYGTCSCILHTRPRECECAPTSSAWAMQPAARAGYFIITSPPCVGADLDVQVT